MLWESIFNVIALETVCSFVQLIVICVFYLTLINLISIASCKTAVTPLLMHWSYCSHGLEPSHQYYLEPLISSLSVSTGGILCFAVGTECHSGPQSTWFVGWLRGGLVHVVPLQWRHNGRDNVSNNQPDDCLFNRLFRSQLWHINWTIWNKFQWKFQQECKKRCFNTLRPRQNFAISQTTLSNVFSSMKMLEFWLTFHWSLFLRVHLTIFRHWFW